MRTSLCLLCGLVQDEGSHRGMLLPASSCFHVAGISCLDFVLFQTSSKQPPELAEAAGGAPVCLLGMQGTLTPSLALHQGASPSTPRWWDQPRSLPGPSWPRNKALASAVLLHPHPWGQSGAAGAGMGAVGAGGADPGAGPHPLLLLSAFPLSLLQAPCLGPCEPCGYPGAELVLSPEASFLSEKEAQDPCSPSPSHPAASPPPQPSRRGWKLWNSFKRTTKVY